VADDDDDSSTDDDDSSIDDDDATDDDDDATDDDDDSSIDDDDSSIDDDDSSTDDDDSSTDDDDSSPAGEAYGPFTGSYQGKNHTFGWLCQDDEEFVYYTPCDADAGACTGSYPVLFWLQGTCMPHDADVVHLLLQEAAQFGFIAVSPQYYNGGHDGPPGGVAPPDWCLTNPGTEFCDCDSGAGSYVGLPRAKAACIFDPGEQDPAVNTICALPYADCDAMVVSGGSQGARVALRAAEWQPVAVASYAVSLTDSDLDHDSRTWLADEDLLESHGANDVVNGAPVSSGFIDHLSLTLFDGQADPELDCTGSCTEPTGGAFPSCDCRVSAAPRHGWFLVGEDQVQDGDPDHAFVCHDHPVEQYRGECDSLDPGFLNPADPSTHQGWSWPAALEFLMARAYP
jgi:hypothetical protein